MSNSSTGHFGITITINIPNAKQIQSAIGNVNQATQQTVKDTQQVNKQLKLAVGHSKEFLKGWERLTIVSNQLLELISKVRVGITLAMKPLEETGQFEQFKATLKNLTGDIESAEDRFKEMVLFAAKTPFDVPGIVEAGNRLQALGRYSLETIRNLGDLAAASGKDVSQAIEAYTNLVVGRQGMAVKQFRALLISTTDWTQELGKAVLKNTGEAVSSTQEMLDALPRIIAKKGFSGLMEEQSKTFLGKMSNFRDALQRFYASIGDQFLEEAKNIVTYLTELFDKLGEYVPIIKVYFVELLPIVGNLIKYFLGFKVISGIVSSFFKYIIFDIPKIILSFKTLTTAVNATTRAMAMLRVASFASGALTAIVGIISLIELFQSISKVKEGLDEGKYTDVKISQKEQEVNLIKSKVQESKNEVDSLKLKEKAIKELIEQENKYKNQLKDSTEASEETRMKFNSYRDAIRNAKSVLKEYLDENGKLKLLTGDSNTVLNNLNNSLNTNAQKLNTTIQGIIQLNKQLIELKKNLQNLELRKITEETSKKIDETFENTNFSDEVKEKLKLFLNNFKNNLKDKTTSDITNYQSSVINELSTLQSLIESDYQNNFINKDKIKNLIKNNFGEEVLRSLEKKLGLTPPNLLKREAALTVNKLNANKQDFVALLSEVIIGINTISEAKKEINQAIAEIKATSNYDLFNQIIKEDLKNRKESLEKTREYLENLSKYAQGEQVTFKNILSNDGLLASSFSGAEDITIENENITIKLTERNLSSFKSVINQELSILMTQIENEKEQSESAISKIKEKYMSYLQDLQEQLNNEKEEFEKELDKVTSSLDTFSVKRDKFLALRKKYEESIANISILFYNVKDNYLKFFKKEDYKQGENLINKISSNLFSVYDEIDKTYIKSLTDFIGTSDKIAKLGADYKNQIEALKSTESIQQFLETLTNLLDELEKTPFETRGAEFSAAFEEFFKIYESLINYINNLKLQDIKLSSAYKNYDITNINFMKELFSYDPNEALSVIQNYINKKNKEKELLDLAIEKTNLSDNEKNLAKIKNEIKIREEIISQITKLKLEIGDETFLGLKSRDTTTRNESKLKVQTFFESLGIILNEEEFSKLKLLIEEIKETKNVTIETINSIIEVANVVYDGLSRIGNLYFNQLAQNAKKTADEYLKTQEEILNSEEKLAMSFARTELQKEAVREQIQKKREEAQEKARKIEMEARKKQFEFERKLAMAQALINIAVAVTKVFSETGTLGFFIAAGIEALLNTVYLGMIASQEFPEYKSGGYTGNKDEKLPAGIVHGKEFVVNAKATKVFRPLLENINKGKVDSFFNGGFAGNESLFRQNSFDNKISANNIIIKDLIKTMNKVSNYLENPRPSIAYLNNREAEKIAIEGISRIKRKAL